MLAGKKLKTAGANLPERAEFLLQPFFCLSLIIPDSAALHTPLWNPPAKSKKPGEWHFLHILLW